MSNNVVSITSELVPRSTVTHYFDTVGKVPALSLPAPTPRPQGTPWFSQSVNQYFSLDSGTVSVGDDVVVTRTGDACSATLGRLEDVFADFGGSA